MRSRRKLLTGGLGACAALPFAPVAALADIRFVDYPFQSTGGSASITMPDRLAQIKNVLDFGADPTGGNVAATTAAIQAAVDSVSGANKGIIYFPIGFYAINAPITFNTAGLTISFVGQSSGTAISGTINGYIFDRHLGSPSNTALVTFEKLNVQNGFASAGSGGIRCGSSKQVAFRDMSVAGFVSITTEDSAGNSSQNVFLENCKLQTSTSGTGTTGLIIGGGGAVLGCDFVGSDFGVKAYGTGLHMSGNRIENCVTAYQLGLDSAGNNVGLLGFSITSSSIEGNVTGIDMAGLCTGGYIGSMGFIGHPTSGPQENIYSSYGLRVRADMARSCVFNMSSQGQYDVAAVSIANASARANNLFFACNITNAGGPGTAWTLPTNAYTALFSLCNTQPVWTYSQLPTGGSILEGDEFSISDSTTATWGANVTTGGGSNRVLVRYNGSNWTVVGK